jgi:polyisoprenoid-binding protein YceI
MTTQRLALVALATIVLTSAALAAGEKFEINDPTGRNTVTFTSEAPLEDIVGTTNQITGRLEFDPANPDGGAKGMLEVPVASLDTGIPLRDEHLRSAAWLNAEGHPNITIEIKSLDTIDLVKSGDGFRTFDVVAVGEFSLNGKTKQMKIPGRVTYLEESDQTQALMPGDLLAVRTTFDVRLADFGVTGPEGRDIIGSKVGETVTVDVSFRASNAGS